MQSRYIRTKVCNFSFQKFKFLKIKFMQNVQQLDKFSYQKKHKFKQQTLHFKKQADISMTTSSFSVV